MLKPGGWANVGANPAPPQDGSAIVVPFNKIVYDGADQNEYTYWRLGRVSFGQSPRLQALPRQTIAKSGIDLSFGTAAIKA